VKPNHADEGDEETREQRRSGSGSRVRVVLRCTYCKDAVGQREAVFCFLCLAPHHEDCRRTHGRCAAPGCRCPATVRPRSSSERRRAVRPRAPAGPRAAMVSLPALLGIVAASAGLAGSATAVALTVRSSSGTQVVITPPAPREAAPSRASRERREQPQAREAAPVRLRLEAKGFTQTVDLAADEQLQVGQVGDGTHAWIVRAGGRMDVVLAVVPAGTVSVGLESELRGLDQRVEPEEAATFEARWQTDWAAGDREGAPAPKLWRFRGLETRR
jgi:hypothetical protein